MAATREQQTGPGSNLGTVYEGQEGFGKAFILDQSPADAIKAFGDLLDDAEKQKTAKVAQDKALQEKMSKLPTGIPEHWNIYDNDIQNNTDKLFKFGADLMASGITDPTTSNHPMAMVFRSELDKLNNKAKLTTQYKAEWEAVRDKINDPANADKYTPESIQETRNFYEKANLDERLASGQLPPNLKIKNPEFKLFSYYNDMAKGISDKNENPTDQDLITALSIGFNDPANSGFKEAIITQFDNIKNNKEQFEILQKQANAEGLSPQMYIAKQQFKSFFGEEAFDFEKEAAKFLPKADTRKSTIEATEGITEGSSVTEVSDAKRKLAATSFIDLNPKAFKYLIDNDLATDKNSAIAYVDNYFKPLLQKTTDYTLQKDKDGGVEGTGKTQEELRKDHDLYRRALMGNLGETQEEKRRNQQLALSYTNKAKTPQGTIMTGGIAEPTGLMADAVGIDNITYNTQKTKKIKKKELKDGVMQEVEVDEPVVESQTYSLAEGNKNYLDASISNDMYMGGIKNQKKLFKEIVEDEQKGGKFKEGGDGTFRFNSTSSKQKKGAVDNMGG